MKQEVSFRMKASLFNFLTLFFVSAAFFSSQAFCLLQEEEFKTHLRWHLQVPRDQFHISKNTQTVQIETLNEDLFKELEKDLANIQKTNTHFSDIEIDKTHWPDSPLVLKVKLRNKNVDLFSFYKDTEKKYILDFWINKEEESIPVTAEIPPPVVTVAPVSKPAETVKLAPTKSENKKVTLVGPEVETKTYAKLPVEEYRDYRYGAAFIWDYAPLLPALPTAINVESKTPEHFWPILDRDFEKDEKEAHMQLSINLYRKQKWGLMAKSISLYEKKYGEDSNNELNEYIKANALLRDNKRDPNSSIEKSAINSFMSIGEATSNYELKKGIFQYLLPYLIHVQDHVQALQYAKKLYVITKEKFDREITEYAAHAILYCLAKLNQIEKIDDFMNEPAVAKLLPKQLFWAYRSYVLLSRGERDQVIRQYEQNKVAMPKDIHEALIFNTAESYFRKGQYEEAITLFDEFASRYSHHSWSSYARTRLALSYEIMGKEIKKVIELYKHAINRSTLPDARFEAKLRYVGVVYARKNEISKEDDDNLVFLNHSPDEQKSMNLDLKKLLWLVRLRTFLSNKQYWQGLVYLTSVPTESMKPAEKRTFDGDGAELVYGLISNFFKNGEHGQVVKLWETYGPKYINKVAMDSYLNFIVCRSFLKLKLNNSFERALDKFKQLQNTAERQFPIWIKRPDGAMKERLLSELELLQAFDKGEWEEGEKILTELAKKQIHLDRADYYHGLIAYKKNDYKEAMRSIEKFLVREEATVGMADEDISSLMDAYTESLYASGEVDKFKKVAKAVLGDMQGRKDKSKFIKDSIEKISYLLIEVLSGSTGKDEQSQVERLAASFLSSFPESIYLGRVKYLLGVSLVRNKKEKDGMDVLAKLLNDTTVPSYIKELARSEISSIRLKNNNI